MPETILIIVSEEDSPISERLLDVPSEAWVIERFTEFLRETLPEHTHKDRFRGYIEFDSVYLMDFVDFLIARGAVVHPYKMVCIGRNYWHKNAAVEVKELTEYGNMVVTGKELQAHPEYIE